MTDITTLVKDDLDKRESLGREKYGGPLYAHTKYNNLQEAYEEILDLTVYLKAELVRRECQITRNVNQVWEDWKQARTEG